MGVLDLFKAKARVNPKETIGGGQTAVIGGYIQDNESNPKLSGVSKYREYSNALANCTVVSAGVRYVLNLIAKAVWSMDPKDESPLAEAYAEFAESLIYDTETPWPRIIRKAAMFRFNGAAVLEWTAKTRADGMIGLADIENRPLATIERWDVDDAGHVLGVWQRVSQTGAEVYIPREKFAYFLDDSISDSPEGMGLFRHIIEKVDRLREYERLEGVGYETDLRGIPVGRAPLASMREQLDRKLITKEQYNAMLFPIRSFLQNHIKGPKLGLMLDSSVYQDASPDMKQSSTPKWDMDLLKAGSTSLPEVAKTIERITHEIARVLGTEGLLLGGDGRGTQALSADKSQNLFLIVNSTLREMAEVVKKDILTPAFQMNGLDLDLMPDPRPEEIQAQDIEKIARALKDIAASSAILPPDAQAVKELFNMLGLTAPEIDDLAADAALYGSGELPEDLSGALPSGTNEAGGNTPGTRSPASSSGPNTSAQGGNPKTDHAARTAVSGAQTAAIPGRSKGKANIPKGKPMPRGKAIPTGKPIPTRGGDTTNQNGTQGG
ncbi:virion protein [Pseudomonas phage KPP23]|nr:virion protein [Pseudomonas phage RSP]BAO53107.1 virion protein [Pseudomonas phage KPP23]